ncbi:MAG: hypothetical protein VYC34_09205, partial [Planctomycetota bacterium]|nr:hypothetical protein [Planctomycetota bacterium]
GLNVSFLYAVAAVAAVWLTVSKSGLRLGRAPMLLVAGALGFTTLLCQVVGALGMLAAGLATLAAAWKGRTGIALAALLAVVPAYELTRSTGKWGGDVMVSMVEDAFGPDRAESLQVRLDNEDELAAKAKQRVLLGWGGWGRNRVYDEWGRDQSLTDGMWIIAFGINGLVGLVAWTAVVLGASARFLRRMPARYWTLPPVGAAASLATVLGLYAIYNLFNAVENPIFPLMIGALAGLQAGPPGPRRRVESRGSVKGTQGHGA